MVSSCGLEVESCSSSSSSKRPAQPESGNIQWTYTMEFPYLSDSSATSILMQRVADMQSELKRLLDLLVDREMINSASEIEIDDNGICPRPQGEECDLCAYTYKKRIIINRADITKSIIRDKVLTCHSFKEGIYAHIDVKSECPKRGVVYFGTAKNVENRNYGHRKVIENDSGEVKPVYKHFINHYHYKQKDDDKDDENCDSDNAYMQVEDKSSNFDMTNIYGSLFMQTFIFMFNMQNLMSKKNQKIVRVRQITLGIGELHL